jgi:hypothetical protein
LDAVRNQPLTFAIFEADLKNRKHDFSK